MFRHSISVQFPNSLVFRHIFFRVSEIQTHNSSDFRQVQISGIYISDIYSVYFKIKVKILEIVYHVVISSKIFPSLWSVSVFAETNLQFSNSQAIIITLQLFLLRKSVQYNGKKSVFPSLPRSRNGNLFSSFFVLCNPWNLFKISHPIPNPILSKLVPTMQNWMFFANEILNKLGGRGSGVV